MGPVMVTLSEEKRSGASLRQHPSNQKTSVQKAARQTERFLRKANTIKGYSPPVKTAVIPLETPLKHHGQQLSETEGQGMAVARQTDTPPEKPNWNLRVDANKELGSRVVHQEYTPYRAATHPMELTECGARTRTIDHQESVHKTSVHGPSRSPVWTQLRS